MAGGADDRLASQQGPRRGQRAVGLAQVHAGTDARGQLGVVVDDQAGLVALAEAEQGLGLPQASGLIGTFVAILQQGDATIERGLHVFQELASHQLAVGDGV